VRARAPAYGLSGGKECLSLPAAATTGEPSIPLKPARSAEGTASHAMDIEGEKHAGFAAEENASHESQCCHVAPSTPVA
jgi:hypothetical protein